jgi:transketolase
MQKFIKRFSEWLSLKQDLNELQQAMPRIATGDVWWCSVGVNVGSEMDGKGDFFTRPVLVLKKLSHETFWGIPGTSKRKEGSWFSKVLFQGKEQVFVLSDIRSFSTRRLDKRIGRITDENLAKIKTDFVSLLLNNPKNINPSENNGGDAGNPEHLLEMTTISKSSDSVPNNKTESISLGENAKKVYNSCMLPTTQKLNSNTLDLSLLEQKPTRDGFGIGLVEAGKLDERVVALSADLKESTRVEDFAKQFPERFFEMGVAEQNLATVASGLANYGKIPFITSYATFSPGRNLEQIRTTIAINNVPVKVVGGHAGISVGPDGATHQALEDIALMRTMPNMLVVVPCDKEEARKATLAIAQTGKPAYLRLGRANAPVFTTTETPFELGKAQIVFKSETPDVGIIACGVLVHTAILTAHELGKQGINVTVLNLATIKPLDREAVVALAKQTGGIVTAEEHQIAGGMGSAVAECLAEEFPVPMEFIGVRDQFGQSGTPDELMKHYHMDIESIKTAVHDVLRRK